MSETSPVGPRRPPEWYARNPHARSSFSRLATHRRCPSWYRYQYLEWHRSPSPAVTRVGQAVQDAFERIVDSEPAPDVTLDQLEERAVQRALVYFQQAWETEARAHEQDPNGVGTWNLPRRRYEGYLRRAVRHHLQEVRARLERAHPRTGAALPSLPAVADVRQAWVATRPKHAPTGESPVASMESVPDGYFQGQCDLVYDWTGARRLADLKASAGKSPFSTEIRLQLLAYAFLDRERGLGRPEGLEAWFLGQDEPLLLLTPEDDELDAFDTEVRDLIRRSGHEEDAFRAYREEDFPPEPAPVPKFAPDEGEASAWCRVCPAAPVCPRSPRIAPPVGDGVSFERIPKDSPPGGLSAEGVVLGVGEPVEKEDGRVRRRFTLANASGAESFGWEADVVLRLVESGLRAGRHVRLTGLNPWSPPSGDVVLLFPTPRTRLEVLHEAQTDFGF